MAFDEYKSTHTVNAEQITEERSVITPNGPISAAPGQWEVRFPDGNVQVVDDEQFTAAFKGGAEEETTEPEEKESESATEADPESDREAEVKPPPKPRSASR